MTFRHDSLRARRPVRHAGTPVARRFAGLLALIALAACGTTGSPPVKPGAYYQNDGPGDRPIAELMAVPDAIPRDEPVVSASIQPYTVLGTRYVPMTERLPHRQSGVASWYGRQFQGRPTSIGDRYDMYEMTAAHPTLPLPSYVKVKNLENDRVVVVRVNDRGPFRNGRIIDLSYAAAARLGYAERGTALVSIEVIDPVVVAMQREQGPASPTVVRLSARPARTPAAEPERPAASLVVPTFPAAAASSAARVASTARSVGGSRASANPVATAPATPEVAVAALDGSTIGTPGDTVQVRVETLRDQGLRPAVPEPDQDRRRAARDPLAPPTGGSIIGPTPQEREDQKQLAIIAAEARRYAIEQQSNVPDDPEIFLQLGAYASQKAASEQMAQYGPTLENLYRPVQIVSERGLHKIQAGPFRSSADAAAAVKYLRQDTPFKPFYVYR